MLFRSRVFLPINLCNEHWVLGEADMLRGSLTFYDSDVITSARHSPLLDLALQRVQAAATSLGRHAGEWSVHRAPCHQQDRTSNDCLIHTVANLIARVWQIRRPADSPAPGFTLDDSGARMLRHQWLPALLLAPRFREVAGGPECDI